MSPTHLRCRSTDSRFEASLAHDGLLHPRLIDEAWARVRARFAPTPLHKSHTYGAHLKLECLQVTGAYKVRGAFNALAAAVDCGDLRPVVAASAGNHALGVAWAARALGVRATLFVPRAAPLIKVAGCRTLGSEIVWGGDDFDSCAAAARAFADQSGARFVHAFDDPFVIAGQATVACELLSARPDVVVVPVGGGGLLAGIGSVLRRAGVRVVGVQVAGVDAFARALIGAAPRKAAPTIADGLRVAAAGALTTRIAAAVFDDLVDDVVVVEESEVRAAVASLALNDKIVAEGAGAAAVAALSRVPGRNRVAVVSGGNIDRAVLAQTICAAEAGTD